MYGHKRMPVNATGFGFDFHSRKFICEMLCILGSVGRGNLGMYSLMRVYFNRLESNGSLFQSVSGRFENIFIQPVTVQPVNTVARNYIKNK